MFENFERKQLELEDVTLNYVKAGEGPGLLMLHGFPQNLAMWARIAPALAQDYTVICADLRGYGDSSKPPARADSSNYSFRQMAQDNLALMRHEGFEQFHVIGHDRGGRTGHRLALDNENAVLSLAVLDIVPTHTMFTQTNHHVSKAYWHWYFLSQPAPFPEHMISQDPDFFYETCLVGWGASSIENFDPEQLADYRRCWRQKEMIHGSCSDYRAASTIDLALDEEDIARRVTCPALVLYGADGVMAKCFDLPATWEEKFTNMQAIAIEGGHFFIDISPDETLKNLKQFLDEQKP